MLEHILHIFFSAQELIGPAITLAINWLVPAVEFMVKYVLQPMGLLYQSIFAVYFIGFCLTGVFHPLNKHFKKDLLWVTGTLTMAYCAIGVLMELLTPLYMLMSVPVGPVATENAPLDAFFMARDQRTWAEWFTNADRGPMSPRQAISEIVETQATYIEGLAGSQHKAVQQLQNATQTGNLEKAQYALGRLDATAEHLRTATIMQKDVIGLTARAVYDNPTPVPQNLNQATAQAWGRFTDRVGVELMPVVTRIGTAAIISAAEGAAKQSLVEAGHVAAIPLTVVENILQTPSSPSGSAHNPF